jgi:hypothetical protein
VEEARQPAHLVSLSWDNYFLYTVQSWCGPSHALLQLPPQEKWPLVSISPPPTPSLTIRVYMFVKYLFSIPGIGLVGPHGYLGSCWYSPEETDGNAGPDPGLKINNNEK